MTFAQVHSAFFFSVVSVSGTGDKFPVAVWRQDGENAEFIRIGFNESINMPIGMVLEHRKIHMSYKVGPY